MVHVWMLLQVTLGGGLPLDVKVFNPNASSYRGSVCLHYIADWGRSKGIVNSTFMKWRWDVLLLWHFPFGGMSKISMLYLF